MDESSKTVDRDALHEYTLVLFERIQGEFAKRSVTGEFLSLGTFGDLALLVAEYRDSDVDSPLDRLIDDAACEADLEIVLPSDECQSLTICCGDVTETFSVLASSPSNPSNYDITFHTAWGLAASEPGYDKAKWSAVPEDKRQPSRTFVKWKELLAECDRKPVELRFCWSTPAYSKAVDVLIARIREACPSVQSVETQFTDSIAAVPGKVCIWPRSFTDGAISTVYVSTDAVPNPIEVADLIAGINSGAFA